MEKTARELDEEIFRMKKATAYLQRKAFDKLGKLNKKIELMKAIGLLIVGLLVGWLIAGLYVIY